MARYRDDDSDSSNALLITAAVVAGLLAGAAVAQRFGGWRGMRRLVSKQRGPLLAALRAALPEGTLAVLLDAVGIDEILAGLLGTAKRRNGRRPVRTRPRRAERVAAIDPDLDEYEVDEFERAAAGLDDEDEDLDGGDDAEDTRRSRGRRATRAPAPVDDVDESDDEVDEEEEDEIVDPLSPEAIEEAVLAAFRGHRILRQRALEIAVDDDGVVELTGWVRQERDVRIARRVAESVPGVERVVVDVAVRDGVRTVPDTDTDSDDEG